MATPVPLPSSKLRTWRKGQSRPVEELAAEVGCTVQAWYDWEKGRRVPSRAFMPKLLALTGSAMTANDFYAAPPMERAA